MEAHPLMEYLYVLTNKAFPGYCKVGRTANPARRLHTYNTGDPDRSYRYAACLPVPNANAAEAAAHRLVRGHRVLNTEWVHLNPIDVVALLKSLPIVKEQTYAH